ncbi:hypothetical protein [Rhodococcus sp. 06-235-1A]|uniref:hypothetical protein n=1 Tax=Rhodococcus sp. 06-235-1A TaxID=2022508 RepID=UPI00211B0F43|nr:hypothetical protein [Rhodococcus sp. 06-235-1A]
MIVLLGFSVGSPVYGIFSPEGVAEVVVAGAAAGGVVVGADVGGLGATVDTVGAASTASHAAGAASSVVGAGLVVADGEVVGVDTHSSAGAGARSTVAASGAADGVGNGVVTGCAKALPAPDISINATAPDVNNDLVAEWVRRRGWRMGVSEVVMDSLSTGGKRIALGRSQNP